MITRNIICVLLTIAGLFTCKSQGSHQGSSERTGNGTKEPVSSTSFANTTKCDVETAGTKTCYEYTNLPEASFSIAKSSCSEQKGVFKANAACSREGNVGGCTQSGNGKGQARLVAYNYSPGSDVNTTKQFCQMQQEQYVKP